MAHEDTFEGKDIIIKSFLNSIQHVLSPASASKKTSLITLRYLVNYKVDFNI